MLSGLLGILHLILMWSRFLSRTLFLIDLVVLWSLAYRAFRDAETMRRQYLPLIGEQAASLVEEE
jgi:predicted membrane-bound mannosyltransferase